MPENEISKMKTKIRNKCKKYCHVKVPYKQKKIISNLSNRKDIVILKQDKDRGVVIMDRRNYTEKCMSLLSSNQFVHIANYPRKSLESKVQEVQNCPNKSTRNCLQQDLAQVNFMKLPRYTYSQ